MSLMTEIRSSVEPKDIDRFDDLVLKKEIEIMKASVITEGKLSIFHRKIFIGAEHSTAQATCNNITFIF